MIQSRCGILCEGCEAKETQGCAGCLEIQRPFWAERCPVKDCCEGKELDHCGECGAFPCELLISFAYHPQQGDNGRRLDQCRCWSAAGQMG